MDNQAISKLDNQMILNSANFPSVPTDVQQNQPNSVSGGSGSDSSVGLTDVKNQPAVSSSPTYSPRGRAGRKNRRVRARPDITNVDSGNQNAPPLVKLNLDNHANQKNPNNEAYWHSRGLEKPDSYPSRGQPNGNNQGSSPRSQPTSGRNSSNGSNQTSPRSQPTSGRNSRRRYSPRGQTGGSFSGTSTIPQYVAKDTLPQQNVVNDGQQNTSDLPQSQQQNVGDLSQVQQQNVSDLPQSQQQNVGSGLYEVSDKPLLPQNVQQLPLLNVSSETQQNAGGAPQPQQQNVVGLLQPRQQDFGRRRAGTVGSNRQRDTYRRRTSYSPRMQSNQQGSQQENQQGNQQVNQVSIQEINNHANRSNQLNPNHAAYWHSRGLEKPAPYVAPKAAITGARISQRRRGQSRGQNAGTQQGAQQQGQNMGTQQSVQLQTQNVDVQQQDQNAAAQNMGPQQGVQQQGQNAGVQSSQTGNDSSNQMGLTEADHANHSNQLNPNNEAYWHSRGLEKPAPYIPQNAESQPNDQQGGQNASQPTDQQKADLDNHSRQLNPNNDAFYASRGQTADQSNQESQQTDQLKADLDNHSRQLNPNNDAFYASRGQSGDQDTANQQSGNQTQSDSQQGGQTGDTQNDSQQSDQQKADLDNHSRQLNPNNDAYYASRGQDTENQQSGSQDSGAQQSDQDKADLDNRSRQLNPNNNAFYASRGQSGGQDAENQQSGGQSAGMQQADSQQGGQTSGTENKVQGAASVPDSDTTTFGARAQDSPHRANMGRYFGGAQRSNLDVKEVGPPTGQNLAVPTGNDDAKMMAKKSDVPNGAHQVYFASVN